jgi:hypothetical protein
MNLGKRLRAIQGGARTCVVCGSTYKKPRNHSWAQFAGRKFCSAACSSQDQKGKAKPRADRVR